MSSRTIKALEALKQGDLLGFGGCAIAIVEKQHTDSFITVVGKKYEERIGYGGTFYIASIGDGAREINREVII
ncbi:hypothetical protein [Pelosinus baikalensis]|nr:hypothetical protein [Pelosinus baikalensis]